MHMKCFPCWLTLKEEAEAVDMLAPEVRDNIESWRRKLFSLP